MSISKTYPIFVYLQRAKYNDPVKIELCEAGHRHFQGYLSKSLYMLALVEWTGRSILAGFCTFRPGKAFPPMSCRFRVDPALGFGFSR
jgi:hypothetical protein